MTNGKLGSGRKSMEKCIIGKCNRGKNSNQKIGQPLNSDEW